MNYIDYEKMVMGLMKSGSLMMQEWKNLDKEIFNELSSTLNEASAFWKEITLMFPAFSIETDYELHHMSLGLCGELGELIDAYKKHIIYQKPLDDKNIIEEFGDVSFYCCAISAIIQRNSRYFELTKSMSDLFKSVNRLIKICGIDIDEARRLNYEKLSIRYKGLKYSDDSAKERADKNPFTRLEFVVNSDVTDVEILAVDFYPDIPEVRISGQALKLETYTSKSGHLFDHELLVQMCKSKIQKEGL